MKILIKWFSLAAAIFLLAKFSTIISIADTKTAIWAALTLGLLNLFIRPILKLLTLPLNIITLGFFTLIINGFILTMVPKVISGFSIRGFWWAVLAAAIIWIISALINGILLDEDEEK